MGLISIGTFTPEMNPGQMTVIRAEKKTASVETYSGVAYFSWPASIVGKIIEMTWNWMSGDKFNDLDTIYAADNEVVFNPNDTRGLTFNVNILSLDGEYLMGGGGVSSTAIRTNVKLRLLIMSQV